VALNGAAPWLRGRSFDGGIDEIPLPPSADGAAGRLWLCGKHRLGPDPQAALREVAATTVVCLSERHELADRYPAYVAWLEEHEGGRALWRPVPDLSVPGAADLVALVGEVEERLRVGERVVVHCGAGKGRAGTLAVALVVRRGLALDDALAHVAAHRPMAGPERGVQHDAVRSLAAG
jgi:protein-tyrosine phosphatase